MIAGSQIQLFVHVVVFGLHNTTMTRAVAVDEFVLKGETTFSIHVYSVQAPPADEKSPQAKARILDRT